MNNFNPDQNPHILSSPENPEEGTGGSNVPPNQAEQVNSELRGEVLEGREGSETTGQSNVEGGDGDLENALGELVVDLGTAEISPEEEGSALEDELNFLIAEEVEASKPKFEVGEDGLSLKGLEIQGIQSQIQQLESGKGDLVDSIRSQITESRQEKIISLEAEKFKLEGEKTKITDLILQAYNKLLAQYPKTTTTWKNFRDSAMKKEAFIKAVEANNTAIKAKEDEITSFDSETKTLIEKAIQDKKTELQGQLTEAQVGYTETGAEANDKPILLERAKEALEQRLSETDFTQEVQGIKEFYISDQDLREIFELYGYIDGMERIKKLKKYIKVYNGSEQTERNIQYFAGITKERELGVIRDEKNTLQKELEDIEGDTSYQEASHLERDKASDQIQLNLLEEHIGEISCEVILTDKGFELKEDYKRLLEELSSKFDSSITSINTELDKLRASISNIRKLSSFQIPEGKSIRVDQLKDIEDYLEENKSKSRFDFTKDKNAIYTLSPILENIKLRITERDKCNEEYHSEYNKYSNNIFALRNLSEMFSRSEYIRGKLGQTELKDKNSITQAINQLREYINQYQKPDDFDAKQERLIELRQKIDTISQQERDLIRYL